MKIDFFGHYHDSATRYLAVDRERFKECGIRCDARSTIDAQSFVDARHEKDQSDPGQCKQIPDRVHTVIAQPIRYQQSLLVQYLHKARRVALWRGIEAPRRIRGSDDKERRPPDKGPAMFVEPGQLLLQRALTWRTVNLA